jgi:uncharacterized Zn finger protein (UPF0148 family)
MLLLKSCPRCRGDLIGGADGELTCIQCGCEPRPQERAMILSRLRAAPVPARVVVRS